MRLISLGTAVVNTEIQFGKHSIERWHNGELL